MCMCFVSYTLSTCMYYLPDQYPPRVSSFTKSKAPLNYAQLAQHGLPVGGRKPSSKRKGASKKTTAAIRQLVQNARENELTKRSDIKRLGINAMTESALKAQPSRSTLSSHLLGTPVSSPDLLPTPDSGVRMSSSVVWPPSSSSPFLNVTSSTTVASGLGVCTNTPQPVDPPPLILCAAPINALASTAQVNILSPSSSVWFLAPPPINMTAEISQPFWVVFLTARISRCQGCLGQIYQGAAPWDVVLQHKQQVLFQNPNTGTWQLQKTSGIHTTMFQGSVWFQSTQNLTQTST